MKSRKDKEDDEEGGDKLGAQEFQDLKNIINVIVGGDGGFPSKRAEANPAWNTLYGADHDKASEIQQGPDLLFQGRSMDQLL
jgi:hypothetical protein